MTYITPAPMGGAAGDRRSHYGRSTLTYIVAPRAFHMRRPKPLSCCCWLFYLRSWAALWYLSVFPRLFKFSYCKHTGTPCCFLDVSPAHWQQYVIWFYRERN